MLCSLGFSNRHGEETPHVLLAAVQTTRRASKLVAARPTACSVRSHLHVACLHDSCYSSKEMQLATCLKRVMQTRYPHSTSLGVCICLCPKSGPWGGLQMDWSEVQLLCRGAQDGLLLRCHLSLAGRERAICLCPSLSICIATPDLLLMAVYELGMVVWVSKDLLSC